MNSSEQYTLSTNSLGKQRGENKEKFSSQASDKEKESYSLFTDFKATTVSTCDEFHKFSRMKKSSRLNPLL